MKSIRAPGVVFRQLTMNLPAKKSVRISKAGDYLKPMMFQYALAAIKSKKEPHFVNNCQPLKYQRGYKKAIIAIAKMMMICIYHMVSGKKLFNPTDYTETVEPHFSQRNR